MTDGRTTYHLVDGLLASFVERIAAGNLPKPFEARDEDGRLISLTDDHLAGKHLILVFLNRPSRATATHILQTFSGFDARFQNHNVRVLAVHSDSDAAGNRELKRASGFAWPILGDPSGAFHAKYGLHKHHGPVLRIVLLTPYRQTRCWYDDPADLNQVLEAIMNQTVAPTTPVNAEWFPLHAPVLIVPKVFTREECQSLVATFESRNEIRVARGENAGADTDFKLPIYEHDRQDRVDLLIRDPATATFLDQRTGQRVNPMIKKAFSFDVTRREDWHIARYVGKRGGVPMGHRDNSRSEVAHRRFAFSMSLNDDYDGGGLVFKEFSDYVYRGEPGTVLIFSSALLHEVPETTRGTRYSLITHLFNDAKAPA
ncbi:MAG: redoxin domain-containing protein [Gammaproteobacteria bacterium]